MWTNARIYLVTLTRKMIIAAVINGRRLCSSVKYITKIFPYNQVKYCNYLLFIASNYDKVENYCAKRDTTSADFGLATPRPRDGVDGIERELMLF